MEPREITLTGTIHIAHFRFYDGLHYVKDKPLKQTTQWEELDGGTGYMVACGDVMVRVPEDYCPHIKRRIITI